MVALDFRMYVYVLPSVRVVIHFESAKRQNPFSVHVRMFYFFSPRPSISLSSQSSGGVGGEQWDGEEGSWKEESKELGLHDIVIGNNSIESMNSIYLFIYFL